MELGKYKIRVNSILPGVIRGIRMQKVIDAKAKYLGVSKKSIDTPFFCSFNEFKIEEDDIGKMCSFLISDDVL